MREIILFVIDNRVKLVFRSDKIKACIFDGLRISKSKEKSFLKILIKLTKQFVAKEMF